MSGLGSASFPEQLVPGSVEAAYEVSHVAQRREKVADEAGTDLRRHISIDGWTGEGADSYAARMSAVAQRWVEIGQGVATIVEPMRTYALALRRAQGLAAAAIEAWSFASTLPEDAAPAAQSFTSLARGWPVLITDSRHQGPAPVTRTEGHRRAEAMLADARADVAAAGEVAAQAVRAAIGRVRARGDVWASVGVGLGVAIVTTERVLDVLQSLDARALTALLRVRPDLIARLKQTPPEEVAPWWRRLTAEQQNVLIAEASGVIGNLGGVAYAARDRANRIVLAQALEVARHIAPDGSDQVRALEALEVASRGRTLASLVLDRPPLAQVAVGSLDRASYVSVVVPGMNTSVESDIQAYVAAAENIRLSQASVSGKSTDTIAVLAWLGYHPPMNDSPLEVFNDDRARVGAKALSSDLVALRTSHAADQFGVDVTAIGHSYGTDVVSLALTSALVDHVAFLGSAGIANDVSEASQLLVPRAQVFATQSTHDGWAPIGQFFSGRTDPTSEGFGAHVFSSERADIGGEDYAAVARHGPFGEGPSAPSYLDPNSAAQQYVAMIAMGRGDEIPEWGNPGQRDAYTLDQADRERYG
ncbi:alpha/beta hydrolase [Microbacterium sp. KSW4-17]|uniref:Alpha/beta hydrolase n=1 Tax=Microbacterium galbum TaxID=3075994 RepID=A0ABU3T6E3_9MICO|nr:alpha/beta hydrolase [Microbacterium sp. KSW4-17]MDU0366946.1 alpha/beta hydrolase [Microbacterium sp. KSW4-17]